MKRLAALERQAREHGIIVDFSILKIDDGLDGLFLQWPSKSVILINQHRCIDVQVIAFAEELGHYFKTTGNIISLDSVQKRKSENAGRAWSYQELLPPDRLKSAVHSGICSVWELAEHFGVTDSFVQDAIRYYQQKSVLPIRLGWCEVI